MRTAVLVALIVLCCHEYVETQTHRSVWFDEVFMSYQAGTLDKDEFIFGPYGSLSSTVLGHAVIVSNLEAVETLLADGASVEVRTDPKERIPIIHLAAWGSPIVSADSLRIADALLEAGADINATDSENRGVIHQQVRSIATSARLLRIDGWDQSPPDESDHRGRWLYEHLMQEIQGSLQMMDYLIERGADINARDSLGVTPLMEAAMANLGEICQYLIDRGANVNARTVFGETALIRAIKKSSPEAAVVLADNGARLDATDSSGKSAWDYVLQQSELRNTRIFWILNDAQFD